MAEHLTVGDILQQIDQRPSDPDLYQQLGGLYLKDGKLDEARQAYERAIELDPKDPFAHLFLGNTLEALELIPCALASYRTATELLPGEAISYWCQGDAYVRLERLDLAQQAYQKAVSVSPDDSQAQVKLAEWNACRNGTSQRTRKLIISAFDSDQAATVITLAPLWLASHHDDVLVIHNYVEMLYKMTRYDEAQCLLLDAINRFKEAKWAFYCQLGSLFRYRGDLPAAEQWYQKAIDEKPEDAGGYIFKGAAQARQGKLQEAEATHRRATQCSEGAIDEAYQNLGLVLRGQGRLLEAAACFQKAIELDAENYDAIEALHDVESALALQNLN